VRFKAWNCGHSIAEVAGSNLFGGVRGCLLELLCALRYRYLRLSHESSRGVLLSVVVSEFNRGALINRRLRPTRAVAICGKRGHNFLG